MPKYAEPESIQELRDAIRRIIAQSGLTEAEASRRLGYPAPSQLNRRLNDGKPAFSREEIERICQEFKLSEEQRIELLSLRGDVVIVQPGQTLQVIEVEQVQATLGTLLRQTLQAELAPFPTIIADALRGVIPWAMLRERAGQSPQVSFEHAQMGDVSIGAVAGRDVITIGDIQIVLPAPPPPLDPFALLDALPTGEDAPIPPADRIALGAVPNRIELLPNELFTGRDHDLRALAQHMKAGQSVVVTTGMGGVGKTQLASEFAYRYGRYFAGGVFWIDCASLERVPVEIAFGGGPGGLDLPGFSEKQAEEQVALVKQAWKQPIPRLLIFDNCEDEKLLRTHRPRTGGCRVLVTSRYQQWGQGQNLTSLDLDVLGRPFSIELLQKLANQYRPDRLITVQADTIAKELGDLPLALQLAGSYLALFDEATPEDFVIGVQEKRLRLPALTNQDELYVPTLEAQQRASGLFAVLTIGLERLAPTNAIGALARTLLARATCLEPVGVTFPRDLLSRTAPVDINDPEQLHLANKALNLLINLGFLDLEAAGRLRMHRLITAAIQQAHLMDDPFASFAPAALKYCADLIARADGLITDGQIMDGRALLDQEQALWLQFLTWSYTHEVSEAGVSRGAQATAQLGNYWTLTGARNAAATLSLLRMAIVAARRIGDRPAQANVLKAIGDVQQFRDDRDGALSSYQQALALFKEIGDRLGEANVLKAIGDVQQFRKETSGALSSYQQALALFKEIGDRLGEANVLKAIGDVQQFRDDRDGALSSYQQALALFKEIGDRLGEANVLQAIGDVQQFRADRDGALSSYQQALALFKEIGAKLGEANVLQAIGDVQQFRADRDGALSSYQQALALFKEIGDRLGEANVLKAIGDVQQFRDDRDGALSSYQQALALFKEIGAKLGEANVLKAIGDVQQFRKETSGALSSYQQALALFKEIGVKLGEANVLQAIGDVQQFRADRDGALSSYQQALALFKEIGDRLGEANVLKAIGDVQQFRADRDGALSSYQQALALFKEIGAKLGEANVLQAIGDVQQFRADRDGALSSYQQALALFKEIGVKLGEANVLAAQSRLSIDIDPAQSQVLFQQALDIRESINDAYSMGADLGNYAIALLQRGRNDEALHYLERARELFISRGITEVIPQTDALIAQARGSGSPTSDVLADLPESVRQAIAAKDNTAFQAALEALLEDERAEVIRKLQEADILQRGPDMAQVLREFAPLLRGIAAVARGDEGPRAEVEQALPGLEDGGWQLRAAVQRIWDGERDYELLTAGVDSNSALLVQHVLELIEAPEEVAGISSKASPLPPQQERGTGGEGAQLLPAAVQAAIATSDPAVLQAALDELPAEERARVEALLQAASEQVIARARSRTPEEIVAALPVSVRVALEQQDEAAGQAALAMLPEGERQRALADMADLQTLSLLAAQEDQQRDPRERFAALLRDIARVAGGDGGPRTAVEQALEQMEQGGWMLRRPVERVWAGERNSELLTEGLDAQDASLIARVLELIDAPEAVAEPERDDRAAVLDDLPESVRTAILNNDIQAFQAALAALPEDEARAIIERLQKAGVISATPPSDRSRPDIDQIIQAYLPILGDIALAAFGDEVARQLADAVLPQLEQGGWRLSEAALRIWAGERDGEQLTAGIDPSSAALVRHTLRMMEDGPGMIFAAGSLQIANLRRQADGATAQALASGDGRQHADLARQLEQAAGQAAQQSGAPWQELAAHMRGLAAQLGEA